MIEMREIAAFLAVGEELHFGRAAERLGVSPSRISHLVRTLERRTGHTLFARTSRRVEFTVEGRRLFDQVGPAVGRIEGALARLRDSGERGACILRVGFSTTLPGHIAPELARAFHATMPDRRIVRSGHPTTEMMRWLGRDWEVDVFVTWIPGDPDDLLLPGVTCGPALAHEPRMAALSADHPLAAQAAVDAEDLADHEVLSSESVPAPFAECWTPRTTPSGRATRLRPMNFTYLEEILRVAGEERVVHLTVASAADDVQAAGLVVRPVRGLPPMTVTPVWPDTVFDPLVSTFVRAAAAHARAAGWLDRDEPPGP